MVRVRPQVFKTCLRPAIHGNLLDSPINTDSVGPSCWAIVFSEGGGWGEKPPPQEQTVFISRGYSSHLRYSQENPAGLYRSINLVHSDCLLTIRTVCGRPQLQILIKPFLVQGIIRTELWVCFQKPSRIQLHLGGDPHTFQPGKTFQSEDFRKRPPCPKYIQKYPIIFQQTDLIQQMQCWVS